ASRAKGGSGRFDLFVQDPRMLAHLPDAVEAMVLEQLRRAGEEEASMRLAPGDGLGDGLHQTAAALSDLLQRPADRYAQDPLAPVALVYEAAGSAPVGRGWKLHLILPGVLDVRELLHAAVLAPALGGTVFVEHQ